MHIQRNKRYYKGKVYRSVLLRQCYYEDKKIKQRTIANLSHMPEHLIRTIEIAIKEKEAYYKLSDLEFEGGYSYGDIAVLYEIIRSINLDNLIYSRRGVERDYVIMMIIGRILHPSSKLENTRWIKKRWEAFSHFFSVDYDKLKVDDLYKALDWVIERKEKIEKNIYKSRSNPTLFLYDITSTYFEGEGADGSAFGYNRDKKKGKKQIVIGLVLDKEGYPLSVEVFRGNTSDQKTLKGKVEKMKKMYGIEKAVLVGDRGMITEARMKDLQEAGFDFITALTHRRLRELIKDIRSPFQIGLFDKRSSFEIEYEGKRYILCKSEEREILERRELASLLWKTRGKLNKIEEQVRKGKLKDPIKIAERVGRWKNRYKVGRYFEVEIGEGVFRYWVNKEELRLGKKLLGCYVIVSTLGREFSKEELVERYKSLSLVENAFKTIKTSLLNIRPIYHWKGARIKAHAFICMLSYYVVVEMKKRLKPLFSENGRGRNYSFTFKDILSTLALIQIGHIKILDLSIQQIGKITPEQRRTLELLKVELKLKREVKH